MVHNEYYGFTMTIIWVIVTLIATVIVAWHKYYSHKRYHLIVNDIKSDKINDFINGSTVVLFIIMMIEAWYPIIIVAVGLPKTLAYIWTAMVIILSCVLHNILLRIVANYVMKRRMCLLRKRRKVTCRAIRRRKDVIALCEKE